MRTVAIGLVALAVASGSNRARPTPEDTAVTLPAPLGVRLADWTLPRASDGQPWSLARDGRDARAVVVLFLGTRCPVNNLYLPILAALHRTYAPRGVLFVAVNSNEQDSAADVARHVRAFALPFVVLKDEGARLADRFAASRTPEAFVLDGTRTARYRGRIDDRYDKGVQRPRATRNDLAEALDAVLAGRTVARPATEAAGCFIARPPRAVRPAGERPVTYPRQVVRLLQRHCQECHRPGESAPFSLLTYKDAAGWSAALREAVAERRMPPWHADPTHGQFANDRRLPDADRADLLAWVDQGCAEGDPADLPPPRQSVRGWRAGRPDAVFTVQRAVPIPAVAPPGGVPYQFFLVSEPFAEEKWVQTVECRPGTPGVVHHITAFVVPPGTDVSGWSRKTAAEMLQWSYGEDSFLGGWAPGEAPLVRPPGYAKRIPSGARLALEVHYTPSGTACTDRSRVGLFYAKGPPRHRVRSGNVTQPLLAIPPGAADHRVAATRTFDRPAVLLSLYPHMHQRGKRARFTLVWPDGNREVLLEVPRYDFHWQTNYHLAEPLHVPAGAKLEFVAWYDNSAGNPNNPNPRMFVFWGQQSWEEMMCGFFEYCWEEEPGPAAPGRAGPGRAGPH